MKGLLCGVVSTVVPRYRAAVRLDLKGEEMSLEAWVNTLLFLLGLAGFVGLFISWPLLLCIVMIAFGWGIMIFTSDGGLDF